MSTSTPYRVADPSTERANKASPDDGEMDLFPVALLFWLGSVLRVAGAWWDGETFGVEATLATLAAVLVPIYLVLSLRGLIRRRRERARG